LGIPVCHDDLMKIRFAVAPGNAASADGDLLGFSNAIEAGGFDGIWLSDVPVAPVIDPLLGLALVAGQTTRLRLGANVVPLGATHFCWPRNWRSSTASRTAGYY
jgi:Luciferase-like monooxygenase